MKKDFFIIASLLFLSSCTVGEMEIQQAHMGVIYTDSLREDSQFVLLDNHGRIMDSHKIKEKGIFQIAEKGDGNLLLPVTFGERLVHISSDGDITMEKTPIYPLYTREKGKIRMTTYNTHLNYGTLEIRQGNKKKSVRLDGFLRIVDFDSRHVYVFATVIQEKRPVLYVIDRETGTRIRDLNLEIDLANDLEITEKYILVSSVAEGNNKIAVISKKDWQQRYISLPCSQPEFIYRNGGKIYITHRTQGEITVLDENTFKVLQVSRLPQSIFKARLLKDKLYVLSQADGKKTAGIIGIYDIHTWKQEKRILLPKIRNTLVQDLTVIQ
ncbi:YncE family protein [Thermoactinomyces mirandus]|uniref:Lipoprotein n=1 Tax=Thermoactinomyces mirandus TaxID=2756294 RepID=A0A7W1XQ60_9BACL|nr:hypothetical protein [Thermoactinomyces mirandus]MBA4601156.1 hypothetical protein [Thermoactinomyces mirandus]